MGIGPHVYLASWAAAATLVVFAVWPPARSAGAASRRLLAFLAGFALVVAPLFILKEGRRIPYFGRSGRHNLVREIRYHVRVSRFGAQDGV